MERQYQEPPPRPVEMIEVPDSLDESAQPAEMQEELDESPPSAFVKAANTLEEMGAVAASWQLEPTKDNGQLIASVDTFLMRIAETKTLFLTKAEFMQSVEDLFDEFKELKEDITTVNNPRRSVKRHASDPPDTVPEGDTAGGGDTWADADTLPPL